MKRGLIRSADGSYTLKLADYDESYHSINGALSESNYIYIGCGLSYYSNFIHPVELNIFEVGLGTGLNCMLSALFAIENRSVRINYSCIEKYPVTNEEFRTLDHINAILSQPGGYSREEVTEIKKVYEKIQYSNWEERVELLPNFTLLKINSDLLVFKGENRIYDIIYFDAFSPNTQPELWTEEIFKGLFNSLKVGGILVTYSSKGIVKQALRDSGFDIRRLPGPKGKRHIIRATRPV